MDRNSFHTLVLLTKEVGGLTDSKYMSSSEKLAMFLNILAHHEKNRSIKVDYIRSGWSGCLGALDGTYIQIRVPSKDKPRYRTRKGEIATNVLGVCDKNLNFTYVLPGWEGSVADGRVLRNAITRTNGLKIPEGRWGILRSPSWYLVKIHNRIISACCLIHNFIRREMEVDPLEIDVEEQVEYQQDNIDVVESSQEWTTWRDELAQSMWNAHLNN
ncbi:hypothetical protein R3W88_029650 [Solanum pinnatisectum]|uniref:DDE Tnp4 domain-containing protein n=1 Tax=Solanum pinnatisectum TaxID=50273 RepID=A0AAV9K883_9SOLN|nr:hypothetical protein R3W88_029650 [Solanum pinnatisectum]